MSRRLAPHRCTTVLPLHGKFEEWRHPEERRMAPGLRILRQ